MKILIAGDFCPIERTAPLIEDGNFGEIFDNVKPIISSADYSIVNFECPIVETTSAKRIVKCGPNLRCSRKAVDALQYAGFQCVTLANNHFRDYDDEGCITTISELEKVGLDYVGGGKNLNESQEILYKTFGHHKLAIINVCEHESSIATNEQAGSAPFDYVDVHNQIKEARSSADYILMIVHGGNEHYQLPSPRMKKAYRWFIDLGVDAVVNHHQHCYNGYEVYKGKPIFYGIGNFCFDNAARRNTIWNEGFMVVLSFEKGKVDFSTHPYVQCKDDASTRLMNSEEHLAFLRTIENLNHIIQSDNELSQRYADFCKEMSIEWLFNMEPYKPNRINKALYRRGLLPSFISRSKAKWFINFIECESQVPKLLSAVYSKL